MEALEKTVQELRKEGGVDITTAEDLSVAVMNLISLEEHFFFTGSKLKDGSYFDLSADIRSMRKELLAKLMPKNEGETWCISKHLLSATMRLMEVGNKLQSEGKKDEAKVMFDKSYKVYSIFWALKMKLIDAKSVASKDGKDSPWTLEDLVTKLADCCNE